MAVFKIFPSADATMYSLYPKKNTGLDEILEVSVKNNAATINGSSITSAAEDLRRSLLVFSDSDIAKIKSYATGSWQSSLRLFLAEAENLNTSYSVEIKQVSQNWVMGTGKFLDYPDTLNGVNWYSTASYSSSVTWTSASYYTVNGGGSWTAISGSQSFGFKDSKDINADVTNIVNSWFSGSTNYGVLVKHPTAIENNASSYIGLKYFSIDTHTIYPPTLEFKWDDSSYITGSTTVVTDNGFLVNVINNLDKFKYGTEKYRMKLSVRDKYPARQFITSSVYLSNKLLPQTSYWAIQDVKTEEMIIDFDTNYTKISADGTYNYFDIHMNGLEVERYYNVQVKTVLSTGETIDLDTKSIFKIAR